MLMNKNEMTMIKKNIFNGNCGWKSKIIFMIINSVAYTLFYNLKF